MSLETFKDKILKEKRYTAQQLDFVDVAYKSGLCTLKEANKARDLIREDERKQIDEICSFYEYKYTLRNEVL